jgi:hypothetical protein
MTIMISGKATIGQALVITTRRVGTGISLSAILTTMDGLTMVGCMAIRTPTDTGAIGDMDTDSIPMAITMATRT